MTVETKKSAGPRKTYRRPVTNTSFWWIRHRRYLNFMLRDFSVIFMVAFLILYLIQFALLAAGRQSYDNFLALMSNPGWIILNLVFIAFALLNSVTWFNLIGVVTPVKIRGKEVSRPALWICGVVGWLIVSVVIAIIVLLSY